MKSSSIEMDKEETPPPEKFPDEIVIEEIDRVFQAQQANKAKTAQTGAAERKAKLKRLLEWIYANQEKIREAVYADFRKPVPEIDLTETWTTIAEAKHAIKHLHKWMKARRIKPTRAMLTTRSYLRYQPKGVVLIISPWNFPFMLAMNPLISALAAGNCAVLKPSEISLYTSHLIKEMIAELFPEDEVAVFEGGRETAQELLKKPFDHIHFTGSTRVGKIVMKAAAENLSSVTLELGGKSPTVVDKTADLPDAAQKIVWGKFLNTGQSCVAPDYVLVEKSVQPQFLQLLKNQITRVYGRTAAERKNTPDFGRVIDANHFRRLKKMVEDARANHAAIEAGGEPDESERYIAPTLILDPAPDSLAMREEIFGPVLPVIGFENTDDVIRRLQSMEKPLNLYIFSKNKKQVAQLISQTQSGAVCVNDVSIHFSHQNLPFGGVRESGFGSSHGFYGFQAFSNPRPVLRHHRFTPYKLIYPPYNRRAKKLIEWIVKYL